MRGWSCWVARAGAELSAPRCAVRDGDAAGHDVVRGSRARKPRAVASLRAPPERTLAGAAGSTGTAPREGALCAAPRAARRATLARVEYERLSGDRVF